MNPLLALKMLKDAAKIAGVLYAKTGKMTAETKP